jgi:HAD superfamily hydrolase (TIGR01509 family)
MPWAVIFDMDGVLVDSEPVHHEVESILFRELGIRLRPGERDGFTGMSGTKMWEYLKKAYGLAASVQELLDRDNRFRLSYFASLPRLTPIEGSRGLLEGLHGRVRLALASSSSPEIIDVVVNQLAIRDFFDTVVSGQSVRRGKPDPDIFLRTASLLGVSPPSCVVIEDSANGVKAAAAAGMACVGFLSPNSHGQDLSGADLVVEDLGALDFQILERLLSKDREA